MIFFDTETTGLITNESLPLVHQPRIIEFAAVKTDEHGRTLDEFTTLLQPGIPLPAVITKITGLRDEDLVGAPVFVEMFGAIANFFLGERQMLAHYLRFDLMMLVFELRRAGKEFQFPFPPQHTDAMTKWPHKLKEWAQLVRPGYSQTHRALDDCRLLKDCWFADPSTYLGPGEVVTPEAVRAIQESHERGEGAIK